MENKELSEKHRLLLNLMSTFRDICDKEGIWYSLAFGSVLGAVRHKGFIPWDGDIDVYIFLKDEKKFRDAFFNNKPEGIMLSDRTKDKHLLSSHDTIYYENEYNKSVRLHVDIYPIVGAPSDFKEQVRFANRNFYYEMIIKSKYVDIRKCRWKNKFFVLGSKIIDYMIPDSVLKNNIRKREQKYDYDTSDYWTTLICYGGSRSCFPKHILDGRELFPFENDAFYIPSGWDEYLRIIYGDYMKPVKY